MFTIDVDNCLLLCSCFPSVITSGCCSPFILLWRVGSMVSGIPTLQTCNVVVVLKQRLVSFQHLRSSSLQSPSDTEVSCILDSFLYPEVARVNVLRSLSCSQSIRQRILRRTITLYLNLHLGIPRSWYTDLRDSPLTSIHHCVKLRFSNAQCCQALKR